MLNRTNRTLSANLNRLNLGTRKLDLNASANIGLQTLRTPQTSTVVRVRTGVESYPGFRFEGPSIREPKPMKPLVDSMSGSSPLSPRPSQGTGTWDQGQTELLAWLDQPLASLQDVVGRVGSVKPLVRSSQVHPSSSLDGLCVRPRQASRSARAALAMVTGATPSS